MPPRRKSIKSRKSSARRTGYQQAAGADAYARAATRRAQRKQVRADVLQGFKNQRGSQENVQFFGADWEHANDHQKYMRRKMGYTGAGDYRSFARYIPRALGAAGGYALNGFDGARAGWNVGGQVSKKFGWGDYHSGEPDVVQNQIMDTPDDQMKIMVNPSDNSGDIIFDHTEFVGNVVVPGSAAGSVSPFTVTSYAVNPGQGTLFPFLSNLARQFEMYEFQGLCMQYKPLSGESATATNSLGKVMLGCNYDPSAEPFISSYSMENYAYSSSCRPSNGMHFGIETAVDQRLTNQLYIRATETPPGPSAQGMKDKMLTDLGLFQVAHEGVPLLADPQIIGELWVAYKVKLSRPTISRTLALKEALFSVTRFNATVASGVLTLDRFERNGGGSTLTLAVEPLNNVLVKYTFPLATQGTFLITLQFDNAWSQVTGIGPNRSVSNCRYLSWTPGSPDMDNIWSAVTPQPVGVGPVAWGNETSIVQFIINLEAPEQNHTVPASFNVGFSGNPTSADTTHLPAVVLVQEIPRDSVKRYPHMS